MTRMTTSTYRGQELLDRVFAVQHEQQQQQLTTTGL